MNRFISLAAFFACLAVIMGAFGAHALKPVLNVSQTQSFETAVKYQFIHSLAILCVAIFYHLKASNILRYAAICWTIGIFLFSGSLYLLSLRSLLGISSWTFLGPITPIGGLSFIAGWICLCIAGFKSK